MDWRYNTIWFEQLLKGVEYTVNLKEQKLNKRKQIEVEYLVMSHYKKGVLSFNNLEPSLKLLYLDIL